MFRKSATILFIALSVMFLGILSVSAAPTAPSNDLQVLGQDFQALREVRGHWDGETFNADVDAPNGKKFQVMQKLYETLGKPGTLAKDVEAIMGQSDSIPAAVLKELKRTEPQITPPTNFKYVLYKWRGYHDYLWFRVNLRTKTVSKSEWYFAYE
ncbi:hypothetical protein BGX28_004959 [Mortierella sp. GBA30]|nr:hypothetical protein BGX28_004959 [Mortierella sp. GBA30]